MRPASSFLFIQLSNARGVTGKDITWGEDGEPNKAPLVLQIKDGVAVEL